MEKSIILIRTSTKEQNPRLQLKECEILNNSKGWDCIKVFERQESAYKNEEGVWKEEIEFAKNEKVKHIIVWNMDRFSRLPEEKVLSQVKLLSTIHNIQIHAVHGDVWSEIVESVGKLKEMGFIGEAISEFLEKLLRGLEFQRANRESKIKSERVKIAVRKVCPKCKKVNQGNSKVCESCGRNLIKVKSRSYKGNKWGRKCLRKKYWRKVIKLHNEGKSYDEICKLVFYWDKNSNKKYISKGMVSKIINKSKLNS